MAQENVIGVAMELDVTDLKSGLAETKKAIQTANKEFAAATSSMDDWSKSSEGVKAKLGQLDTTLKNQKKNVKGLEAELERAKSQYGENSEAVRKLKDRLLDAQAAVGKTEKQQRKYTKILAEVQEEEKKTAKESTDLAKAIKSIDEASDKAAKGLQAIGKVGKGVATGVGVIGGATAGLVGGFLALGESTREYREDMGKLETAFESTGKSTELAQKTYQDFYSVLGEEDRSVEAVNHLAKFVDSEKDMAKWGTIAAGVTATFGDSLPIEGLTEASNETAKTGKVTGVLADALEWSGVSAEDFNKSLENCANEQERSALITNTLNGLYDEAGKKYQDVNADVIASRDAQASLTDAIAELGAIAEPIMTTLKNLASDLLTEMLPFVKLMGEGLSGALAGNEDAADQLAEGVTGVITTLVDKITEMLPFIIETIMAIIPKLLTALLEQLPSILQLLIDAVTQIINAITEMLPTLIPILIDTILKLIDVILDNLDQFIDAGIELILALADGLIEALPKLLEKLPTIIDKVVQAIANNLPKIIQAGFEILLKLIEGLIKAIPDLLAAIPTIIDSLIYGFADYRDNIKDVGLELVKGIWEGIKDGAKWLQEKITGFADDVAGWFKKTFKIHSPSRLMEDEIGKFIGLGVGEGILDSTDSVLKDIDKFGSSITKEFASKVKGINSNLKGTISLNKSQGVFGSSDSTRTNVNNFTQIINAPKQPSRIELYRQTKNLLALKGGN